MGSRDWSVISFSVCLLGACEAYAPIFPAGHLSRLARLNRHILLLLLSLNFPGPVQPILKECRKLAMEAAELSGEWPEKEPGAVYASNFLVRTSFHPYDHMTPPHLVLNHGLPCCRL